jgi:DNA-binding response OmpR family regulator
MGSVGRLRTVIPSEIMRVLICDDEEALLQFLGRVLRGAGHDVLEAHDGRETLQLLEGQPCDLVLIDIFMDGQEGIETILTLRQRWPTLTIIAMSGGGCHGDIDVLTDARMFGADHTLPKPFRPTDLLRVVEESCVKDVRTMDALKRSHGLTRTPSAGDGVFPTDKRF